MLWLKVALALEGLNVALSGSEGNVGEHQYLEYHCFPMANTSSHAALINQKKSLPKIVFRFTKSTFCKDVPLLDIRACIAFIA